MYAAGFVRAAAGTDAAVGSLMTASSRLPPRLGGLAVKCAAECRLPQEVLDSVGYLGHAHGPAPADGHRQLALLSRGPQKDHTIPALNGDYGVAPVPSDNVAAL